ncbi:MAG: hypothetical protein H7836_17575 [Magnetococcus sp. YQC-3]
MEKSICILKQKIAPHQTQFYFERNKQISFTFLSNKILKEYNLWIKINYNPQANNGHPSYVIIKMLQPKITLRLHRNGEITIWHSLPPLSLNYLMDFFWLEFVQPSLELIK